MPSHRLLREYVRNVLTEDEAGGGGEYAGLAAADAEMNPYGMRWGSDQQLYKVFVKPFVDVVGVASGKAKELSTRAQTLVRTAFEAVATSFIPVLSDDYHKVFAHEQEQIAKVRQEYADVYQATWDAFEDNDVLVAAFMYSPSRFLTRRFAQRSPQVAAKLISVLSGGTLDTWLAKVQGAYGGSGGAKKHHGLGLGTAFEGHVKKPLIREDAGNRPPIDQVLANPKVLKRLDAAPKVQQMEKAGRALVRGTLERVYKQAHAVSQAPSVDRLNALVGGKLKGVDDLRQAPDQERQQAEQALLTTLKKSAKDFYVKSLEGQLDAAKKAGVPDDSAFVADYRRAVSKLKAL